MKKLFWILIALLVTFSLLQIPSSDDYCNKVQVTKMGVLPYVSHLYLNWTGRFLTSMWASQFLDFLPARLFNVVSLFNLFAFIGSLCFIVKSWIPSRRDLALLGLMVVFFLGARSSTAQFIFWPTGGIVYSFSYLVFFLCLYFLQKEEMNFFLKLGFIFLGSSLIESINPAFLVFLFVIFKNEKSRKKQLLVLITFGVASVFLFLAPGNFSRASSGGGLGLNPLVLIQNYFYVVYKSLRYVWISGLLALTWGVVFSKQGGRISLKLIEQRWYLLLAAFASISPFMLTPTHFNSRSSSFFLILLCLFIFVIGFRLNVNKKFNISDRIVKMFSFSFSFSSVIFLILFVALDVFRMIDVRSSFLERDGTLSNSANLSVKIRPLITVFPSTAHFDDVKINKNHWINKCVAGYYRAKEICLDDLKDPRADTCSGN